MGKFDTYPPAGKPIYYNLADNQKLLSHLLQDQNLSGIADKADQLFEKDIASLQAAVLAGHLTYEQIMAYYLERIQRFDQVEGGTNAFISLNPEAMNQARQADAYLKKHQTIPSNLFGLPIAVKDNVLTKEMPTSVGTYYLKDFMAGEEASLVTALKQAGAIIIGKTNLSELANFMGSQMPSGYSSAGGQTLNPYDKVDLTPLGSSSGSGVAASLNMAVATIGTETTGSITAPAAVTSTVGFKPTIHAALDEGIFPLSSTMDCPGPITRTVADAIAVFECIRQKPASPTSSPLIKIGVSTQNHPLKAQLLKDLTRHGYAYEMVDLDTRDRSNLPIILADFAFDVADFATRYRLPFKQLAELVAYNQQDLQRRALYGQDLVEEAVNQTSHTKEAAQAQVQAVKTYLESLDVDVILSFNNWDVLLPATAGYPELTIPYGVDEEGAPQGLTLISRCDTDDALLAFGQKLETLIGQRVVLSDGNLTSPK